MIGVRFAPLRLFGVESGAPRWPLLVLSGQGLVIRPPDLNDFQAWSTLRRDSHDFLKPWEPLWPEDDLTRPAFKRRIRRYDQEIARDEAYPFFIFRENDDRLLGGLTIGNVRRGAAQSATLGYWMGAPFAGRGIMGNAVRIVCRHGFSAMSLERIEAACLPENAISIKLLEKAGFEREGYARNYLSINGARRDHVLFALHAAKVFNPDSAFPQLRP